MTHEHDATQRLIDAYNRMMERVHKAVEKAEADTLPSVRESIEKAAEKAVELGEVTREEAEKIADWVRRDVHDAGEFLSESGREFSDWLRFDLKLIEDKFLDLFSKVADQTSVELIRLAERAREATRYHTGEITGPGTLVCVSCEQLLHFESTGHIPPCPHCKGTEFRR